MTEFSDFQCPYCRHFAMVYKEVAARYEGRIALSYRHFPIESIHPHAHSAALAAECAARQGHFAELHDSMLSRQDSIGVITWLQFAERAGVGDPAALLTCMTDPAIAARVAADKKLGTEAEVRGTPTVFVNEWRLPGTPSVAQLDSIVRKLLAEERH